jgi:PPE-repeat protein
MDFGTRPPEINSGLLFSGPGLGSMTSLATAWDELAAWLDDAAASYHSATAKTRAAGAYLEWLDATAARARQTATQARAAAIAFRSALAAAAPPPVIRAHHITRVSLAMANCLGQSAPAIADMDADYERMWTRNADVMYAYARASADAATVTPFDSPPGTAAAQGHGGRVSWTLRAAPDVLSAGRPVMSTIPGALRALARSPLATFDASLAPVTSSLSKLSSLSAPTDFALKHLNSLNKEAALRKAAILRWRWTRPDHADGAAETAALGRGSRVGVLSVPRSWMTEAMPDPVAAQRLGGRARLVYAGQPPKPGQSGVT